MVNTGNETDDNSLIIASAISSVALALVFVVISYNFPIKDSSGAPQRTLSVLLALFVFPAYLLIYLIQEIREINDYKVQNN